MCVRSDLYTSLCCAWLHLSTSLQHALGFPLSDECAQTWWDTAGHDGAYSGRVRYVPESPGTFHAFLPILRVINKA